MRLKTCPGFLPGELDVYTPAGHWLGGVLRHGESTSFSPAHTCSSYSSEELEAIAALMLRFQASPEPVATQVLTAAVIRFNRLKAEAIRRCPWTS